MTQIIKNVMLMGAGGLLGSEILAALQKETSLNLTILSRKSSKSAFPSHIKIVEIDDDYPNDQLIDAFTGQDAVVLALPGSTISYHSRMVDAAVKAGIKRFIPSEFGNNTCAVAADLVPLYADKAKVVSYLVSKENTGLTWTAIHSGQFFDWGLESGWLDYNLKEKRATVYDSGTQLWSTTILETVATAVVRVLLKPEETKNRPVFVASFTVSQLQVLQELEKATGSKWEVQRVTSKAALERADMLDKNGDSDSLKLRVLMLLYADGGDRGANFKKGSLLSNKLLELPEENLSDIITRIINQQKS